MNGATRKLKRKFKTNENENMFPNLWDVAKAVQRGKYIAIQAYLRKQEVSNTQPNLTPKGAGKGIANIA